MTSEWLCSGLGLPEQAAHRLLAGHMRATGGRERLRSGNDRGRRDLGGLEAGDRVVLTRLSAPVIGMEVEIEKEEE